MRGYVAVGHGRTPSGVLDPGAVNPDGTREYDLAFTTTYRFAELLRRSGVDVYTETNGGPGHDPDYRGSAAAINAGGYSFAIEVHYDSWKAPRGGFGLWRTTTESMWTMHIADTWRDMGLRIRPNTPRNDLYILKAVTCPVIIWECDHTAADVTDQDMTNYAVGLAAGTVNWLRQRFNPSIAVTPVETGDKMPFQVRVATAPDGRFWVLTGPEGGVDAMGPGGTNEGGSYHGNLLDHPEYNAGEGKSNGPAVDIAYWPGDDMGDGYVIYCDDRAQDKVVRPYRFNARTDPK